MRTVFLPYRALPAQPETHPLFSRPPTLFSRPHPTPHRPRPQTRKTPRELSSKRLPSRGLRPTGTPDPRRGGLPVGEPRIVSRPSQVRPGVASDAHRISTLPSTPCATRNPSPVFATTNPVFATSPNPTPTPTPDEENPEGAFVETSALSGFPVPSPRCRNTGRRAEAGNRLRFRSSAASSGRVRRTELRQAGAPAPPGSRSERSFLPFPEGPACRSARGARKPRVAPSHEGELLTELRPVSRLARRPVTRPFRPTLNVSNAGAGT
jgi:hypothetical protein